MESLKSNIQYITLTRLLKTDFGQFDNASLAFGVILKELNNAIHVNRIGVWELQDDKIISESILQDGELSELQEVLLEKNYPEYFKCVRKGLPLVSKNALSDKELTELVHDYLKPLKIASVLNFPIYERGIIIGLLSFEQIATPREWTENEIDFGNSITGLMSLVRSLFMARESESKLFDEKDLLRTVVDRLPLGVFVKDKEHKLTLLNYEGLKYIGVKSEEEVIGKRNIDLFPEQVSQFSLDQDKEIHRTGKSILKQESFQVRPSDLSFRRFVISKIPIEDENKKVKGLIGIVQDITEPSAREAELMEREEKYRFIAENTTDGFLVSEGDYVTYVSPSCEKILGYSIEETMNMQGEELFNLIHPEDMVEIKSILEKAIAERRSNVIVKHRARQKSGKYIWRENAVNYFYNSEGTVWRAIVLMRDITEFVLSDIKLKESERLLGDILHSLDEAVWAVDFYSGTPIFMSKSFEYLFGFTLEDWKANPDKWKEVIHEEDKYIVDRIFEDVKDRKFGPYTVRVFNKSGEVKWAENRGKILLDEEGKPKILLGMAGDITEKVLALKELERSEKQLSLIMNSLDEVVWAVKLPAREPLFVSNSFEKVFGIPIDNWYEDYAVWSNYVTEEFREKEKIMLQKLFSEGFTQGVIQIKDADGHLKWLECTGKYVYNDSNELEMMLGISVDITEQINAEERLKSSERNLSDILNALDEAVWAASIPKYEPLFVSKSFVDFYGFGLEEWKKDWKLWERAVHLDDAHMIKGFKDNIRAYESISCDCRIVNLKGEIRWVENIAKTIFDENGKPYMVLGIAIDITNRKRGEQKLNEVKEQALKSEMARAELELKTLQMQMNPHFIFNSLNSIQSFILKNDVVSTNDYLSKFARLIRSFLDSSRSVGIRLGDEINLLKLYVEMEQMRFEDKFVFKLEIEKEVDKMIEIPTMMLQPFVENAINHGIRYKKGKGLLSVSFQKEGEYILCKIEDDGVGRVRSKEILDKTNKGYISQGLKITAERFETYNAINKTNINYEISDLNDNEPDVGTSVKVYFPISTLLMD